MGVIYDAATRTARMNEVLAAIDSGGAAGKIEIRTSANVVLAELPLSYPCGVVSSDTLTFSAITSDSSANATGTANNAVIKDSTGTIRVSGLTVGTSGANINMTSTSFTSGQVVSITSAVLQHNTTGT